MEVHEKLVYTMNTPHTDDFEVGSCWLLWRQKVGIWYLIKLLEKPELNNSNLIGTVQEIMLPSLYCPTRKFQANRDFIVIADYLYKTNVNDTYLRISGSQFDCLWNLLDAPYLVE